MNDFNTWWSSVGSSITVEANNDHEEHSKKVAIAAWNSSSDIDKKACVEGFVEFLNIPPDIITPSFLQTKIVDFLKAQNETK